MNFKNKLQKVFLFLLFIIPLNVFAYSDYIFVGGNNIGIEVNSKGIMVVGFYKVNNKDIARNSGFNLGDKIIEINYEPVKSIDEMIKKINKYKDSEFINFTVLRNQVKENIKLKLIKDENNVYKTGLYVKDQITGIGTLTYIDPETKIFGALGHEIVESSSNTKIEVKDGKIFKANIVGITKSTESSTGEKKAIFDEAIKYGSISENTTSGIFGKYENTFDEKKLLKVGKPSEIKNGSAKIRTVLDGNNIEEFEINVLKVNNSGSTKNILFEISDEKLKAKTNGIIKGMSGSPIIQDNKIIGAVTHAIVNDNNKGYGIFITTMLEEGEN